MKILFQLHFLCFVCSGLWSKKFEGTVNSLYLVVIVKYSHFEGLFTCLWLRFWKF